MKKTDFIKAYMTHFRADNEFQALFEMGGALKGKKRIEQVVARFEQIAGFVLDHKEVWVLLKMWNSSMGTKKKLEECGFKEQLSTEHWKGKLEDGLINSEMFDEEALEDCEIMYLQYEKYSFDAIRPLIQAIAGYELGFKKSASISAYFLTFEESPTMLNLYDDRGMELLSNNDVYVNQTSKKFNQYILQINR